MIPHFYFLQQKLRTHASLPQSSPLLRDSLSLSSISPLTNSLIVGPTIATVPSSAVSLVPSFLLSQLCFILAVTDLALSHSPLPLSSSSLMAISVTRPHSTSFSIFFSFWVQFASFSMA